MSAIPEGWKLVPVNVTPEWAERLAEIGYSRSNVIASVLAAAPQPTKRDPLPTEVDEAQLQRLRENGAKAWAGVDPARWVDELRGNEPEKREPCTWTKVDDEFDTWQGSCGSVWSFIEGGPVENGQRFCPKCGAECKEVRGGCRMTAPQWFSGPPPARGWWPASTQGFRDFYRWWDGSNWSKPAHRSEAMNWAIDCAHLVDCVNQKFIKWRHWSLSIDGTDGKGAHE